MPGRCVVGGCSNTHSENAKVSLHKWPRDEKSRKLWTRFVQNSRADFAGPSTSSVICSDHFLDEDYDPSVILRSHLGIAVGQRRVLPGRFPTVKKRKNAEGIAGKSQEASAETGKKPRLSSERRQRQKEVAELIKTSDQVTTQEHDVIFIAQADEVNAQWKQLVCEKSSQTKKMEGPVQKKVYKRSAAIQVKPNMKNKETQTLMEPIGKTFRNVEVQCSLIKPLASPVKEEVHPDDLSDIGSRSPSKSEEYVPSENGSTSTDDDFSSENEDNHTTVWEEDKFIIFKSCLLMLFSVCLQCTERTKATIKTTMGTMVSVFQKCKSCGWKRTWRSQPYIKGTPAGNILLSASILFAGGSVTKVLRVLNFFRCQTISERTYFRHQKTLLHPAIIKTWESSQDDLIHQLIEEDHPLILGGDARADSPGHTAKYGSYSLMELRRQKVLDVVLVQKNEVTSSNAMELEGLKRVMRWMLETGMMSGIAIECFITDRHLQVAKWVRENLVPLGIHHYYDVWHITKSIKKKLKALGKRRGCEAVLEWQQSIINHVYWAASSTPEGDQQLILEKFLSIENHVQNIHTGHQGERFTECAHPPISDEEERTKNWLEPGTEACEKLVDILNKGNLKKDIKMMSPKEQTSSIEAFHSLITQFAPKQYVYSYEGMTCRLLLAALHYNENSEREQETNKMGEPIFKLDFPRAKGGGYTLRRKPVKATFEYVNDLLCAVIVLAELGPDKSTCDSVSRISSPPPPLTSSMDVPTLEDAIKEHYTRFRTAHLSAQEP